ncbi:sensor histidine kinase [Epilithonimonas sp.]|uniref:sensor histidine kinase n=1 Tax=Epilithonimonas sp. TaxID=2894511 RepID=UPI0035B4BBC8
MDPKDDNTGFSSFKYRKVVHYSLIICILFIQIILAGYFYNEFRSRENLSFLQKQLSEINILENLTEDSKKELVTSQDYFQKYLITNDQKYLNAYFASVNKLTKNIDSINSFNNPRLDNIILPQKRDSSEFRKLKMLADSSYQFSTKSSFKVNEDVPKFKKYDFNNYNFEKFDIETKTVSDTVKKKGLFGRLGDAIAGKVDVQKESTIITVKNAGLTTGQRIKSDMDSIVKTINNHYSRQVQKIQVNINNNRNHNGKFYKVFNELLIYSNDLMNIYDVAIKDSKTELQREYEKQTSKNNETRNYLVLGAMILMFIVSILIMLLTRIAFVYERRLKDANIQIRENLSFKNRILGMLSHEMRSPLKIIGLFINRISKKTNDESIKEYLKSISFTNNSILIQANQILEYTKNQHKENKLTRSEFNLKDEITSIMTSVEPFIETRNNKFIVKETISPDLEVYSDNAKIHQVYMNILGNANKFTENGQITVNIKTETVDQNTISLVTEINDTGAGISKSDLEKIFEPYYQGVLSEDVENLGAGLGLSLCKEIVELFSGKITADSELGKGTTVKFNFNLDLKK